MNLPGNTVIDLLAVLPDGQLVHSICKINTLSHFPIICCIGMDREMVEKSSLFNVRIQSFLSVVINTRVNVESVFLSIFC